MAWRSQNREKFCICQNKEKSYETAFSTAHKDNHPPKISSIKRKNNRFIAFKTIAMCASSFTHNFANLLSASKSCYRTLLFYIRYCLFPPLKTNFLHILVNFALVCSIICQGAFHALRPEDLRRISDFLSA